MKKLVIWTVLFFLSLSAQAADNIIQNGDLIRISVYGNPDLTTEAKVNDKGSVSFPLIGDVSVSGQNASDAEKAIGSRLINDGFLRQAQVNIVILQSTGQQVSVLGQVAKPGKYSIDTGAKSLFDFIALSGGVSAKGSYVITVLRMSDEPPRRISVNVDNLLLRSSADQINTANMTMKAGDVIYVPEAPVFYIYGEANRPGSYRFKAGMTVAQAIATGGGVSQRGTLNGLVVERKNEKGELIEIDADSSTIILADDIVYVKESLF